MQLHICEMETRIDKVFMRFEVDYEIVLECIYEVYGLETHHLYQGKDFRKTMVLPFMKMLERHCGGVQMESLHKVLWEVHQESTDEKDFLEKAEIILKPYYREIQSFEQNAGV